MLIPSLFKATEMVAQELEKENPSAAKWWRIGAHLETILVVSLAGSLFLSLVENVVNIYTPLAFVIGIVQGLVGVVFILSFVTYIVSGSVLAVHKKDYVYSIITMLLGLFTIGIPTMLYRRSIKEGTLRVLKQEQNMPRKHTRVKENHIVRPEDMKPRSQLETLINITIVVGFGIAIIVNVLGGNHSTPSSSNSQQTATSTFTCSDGTVISGLQRCPQSTQTYSCSDGTEYGKCSSFKKSMFCTSDGRLITDIDSCGCPAGERPCLGKCWSDCPLGQDWKCNVDGAVCEIACESGRLCLGQCWNDCPSDQIWRCGSDGGVCDPRCKSGQLWCLGQCWYGCASNQVMKCGPKGGVCVDPNDAYAQIYGSTVWLNPSLSIVVEKYAEYNTGGTKRAILTFTLTNSGTERDSTGYALFLMNSEGRYYEASSWSCSTSLNPGLTKRIECPFDEIPLGSRIVSLNTGDSVFDKGNHKLLLQMLDG